jgi:hypothetical protein
MFAIKIFLDKPVKKYLLEDSGAEDGPDDDNPNLER